MAEIVRYVDTGATGAGTGLTWTDAYTSLNAWEAASQANLAGSGNWHHVYVRASTGAADTGVTTIDAWTTSSTEYILIEGTAALTPSWNTGIYRLQPATGNNALVIREQFVRVTNLQVGMLDHFDGAAMIGVSGLTAASAGGVRLGNLVVKGASSATKALIGIQANDTDLNPLYAWNVLAFDQGAVAGGGVFYNVAGASTWYNCVSYGGRNGFIRSNGTMVATNCIAAAAGLNNFSGTITVDYCLSDAGTGTHAQTPAGGSWANEFTTPGSDFSLKAGGNAIDHGTDNPGAGLYSADITGTAWTSPWDIGAAQAAANVSYEVEVVDGVKFGDSPSLPIPAQGKVRVSFSARGPGVSFAGRRASVAFSAKKPGVGFTGG